MNKTNVIIALVAIASIATADISVETLSNVGLLKAGETAPSGTTVLDSGVLVQLVWTASSDGYQSGGLEADLANDGEIILTSGAADQSWGRFNFGGALYTDSDVGGADVNSGYFFARVFDSAAPAVGASFVEFGRQGPALSEFDAQNAATAYTGNMNDLGNWAAIDSQGTTVIPEPATIGLLGIASAGLFAARRKTQA
tara:strand:+ start:682 stop:1275 length:594 start_codon:yes stop_codon:yes gene_type:complete